MFDELRDIFRGLNAVADVRRFSNLYARIEEAAIELLEERRVLTKQFVTSAVDAETEHIQTSHPAFLEHFSGVAGKGEASKTFFDKVDRWEEVSNILYCIAYNLR